MQLPFKTPVILQRYAAPQDIVLCDGILELHGAAAAARAVNYRRLYWLNLHQTQDNKYYSMHKPRCAQQHSIM